jgi:chemotaxis protein MotB
VKELEDLIAQKDAAVRALKDRIKAALSGFADKGIKVEQKNGRVYVSMEAKLLFASGSTSVGTEGKVAVLELAKALEGIEDLTILVEGHTDDDPIKTACINDNWDLSVMRATSVVRIMLEISQLDPAKLTAAGRGEFFPVAPNDTRENKAKNRRIEVILTPNLDKLFELLEEGATASE